MMSIIIPTFNEERYLPKLLESIKMQDCRDYEIIVSDAQSKDRTREIAKINGCRVVEGGVPAVERNNGAKVARGKYLLFFDADVILPNDFLPKLMREFKTNKLDVASCRVQPLSERMADKALHGFANFYIHTIQYLKPHAPGFCILIKKSTHNKINGFNTNLKLNEDHDYVKRAKSLGRFKILPQHLFVSVRRLDKEGRINISLKYFFCELCYLFLSNNFLNLVKYSFGGY